jgi:magnesium-transporting ATPase (P-type)
MGETVIVITNGAEHTNTSSDSSTVSSSQDDKPPIAEPPDISAIEKPQCPHTLPARRVAELLETHIQDGLNDQEAAARLARDGPNTIKGAKGISIWEIFLQQVANALTVVLIAVMALSFAIHDFVEGGVVLAVILLNIIVGYVAKKKKKNKKTDAERKRPSLFISFPFMGTHHSFSILSSCMSCSHDLFENTG